jgi:hypothetical protein
MHIHSLGPHTFFTPPVHERRHDWLSRFKPSQRRALIEEDCSARAHVFAVMVGAMLFGLATLLVTVLLAV